MGMNSVNEEEKDIRSQKKINKTENSIIVVILLSALAMTTT